MYQGTTSVRIVHLTQRAYNPKQMRKLRILVFEVIGLGVLIGWLMWKYPELVDDIIPWVALLVAWHFTWEFVLDTKWARRSAGVIGKKVNHLIIWPLVFLVGVEFLSFIGSESISR